MDEFDIEIDNYMIVCEKVGQYVSIKQVLEDNGHGVTVRLGKKIFWPAETECWKVKVNYEYAPL